MPPVTLASSVSFSLQPVVASEAPAVLHSPPDTLEPLLDAVLADPPLTEEPAPVARFSIPPETLEASLSVTRQPKIARLDLQRCTPLR